MAGPDPIERLLLQLDPCGELAQLVIRALVDEPPASLADAGVIRPGYSAELDNLIASASQARQYVAGLERTERERTGVRSLKVGYNKVFGYYIEVTNPSLDTVLPDHVRARRSLLDNGEAAVPCACQTHREHLERCLGYVRKQTLVGAERFITSDLKEYESIILNAQERQVEMETALFRDLCTQIGAQAGRVLETASALAHLDVFSSLAEVASRNGYVRPQLDDGSGLRIVGGRHPVVERTLTETRFVPNDLSLSSEDCQVMVLTGPNMAGKSTYILTAALIVLMAQIGSFVPAESAALGLVDRVFTRVGAQHDIAAGQSTFLVEMSETANILNHATPRSLLVLDEIGRGTSTYDGLSIARAVVEFIHNHPRLGCKTLFATHYHELTEVEKYLPRVRNFRMDVLEEGNKVVFLHRVVPGGADRSYGIHVARLAGIPRAVTRRAEEILRDLENGGHDRRGRRETRRPRAEPTPQLPLFAEPHPAFQELATLDVASMTPLEAITKLFELQQKAKGNG